MHTVAVAAAFRDIDRVAEHHTLLRGCIPALDVHAIAPLGLALDALQRFLNLLRRHALIMRLEEVREGIAEGAAPPCTCGLRARHRRRSPHETLQESSAVSVAGFFIFARGHVSIRPLQCVSEFRSQTFADLCLCSGLVPPCAGWPGRARPMRKGGLGMGLRGS